MQQYVYETKICDIDDLQKRLMQTCFDSEQNVIEDAIDMARKSEILCERRWRTLWTHAVELLFICIMWFSRIFCETGNVTWCIWRLLHSYINSWIYVHMYFRCFNFNKVV